MDPRAIAGVSVVVISTALVLGAHRRLRAGAERTAITLLLIAALLLRVFAASDPFLHDWDERYHALVAKHLSETPGIPTLYADPVLPYDHREWVSNHIWLHKEPLGLWTMAACIRMFGANEFAIRIPSILLGVLAVGLTYWIGRAVGGRRAGLMAATLHTFHGLLIELTAGRVPTDHIDAQFVVLVELGAAAALLTRRWPWGLAGLAVGSIAGLAALTKSVTGWFVILLWGALAFDWTKRRGLSAVAGVSLGIVAAAAIYWPWHTYIQFAFPQEAAWESEYNLRHLWEVIEGHGGSWAFHATRLPRYYGELSFLSLIWFLVGLRRGEKRTERIFVALWFAIPYAFFTVVRTKMPAYVLVAAPALFIIIGMHWVAIRDYAKTVAGPRRRLAQAALVLLIALPLRFGLERLKPISSPAWDRSETNAMIRLGDRFADENTVVFHAPKPVDLMFYSSVIAYPQVPSEAEVATAIERGYRVAILDGAALPAWIRDDPRITVVTD